MGLKTRMNITGERGSPWKVPVLNGNLVVVHDGPVITPLSREYRLVIYVDAHSGNDSVSEYTRSVHGSRTQMHLLGQRMYNEGSFSFVDYER